MSQLVRWLREGRQRGACWSRNDKRGRQAAKQRIPNPPHLYLLRYKYFLRQPIATPAERIPNPSHLYCDIYFLGNPSPHLLECTQHGGGGARLPPECSLSGNLFVFFLSAFLLPRSGRVSCALRTRVKKKKNSNTLKKLNLSEFFFFTTAHFLRSVKERLYTVLSAILRFGEKNKSVGPKNFLG